MQPENYHSIVGKMMYLVTKLWIKGGNPAIELAGHFSSPGKKRWKVVERAVRYLK